MTKSMVTLSYGHGYHGLKKATSLGSFFNTRNTCGVKAAVLTAKKDENPNTTSSVEKKTYSGPMIHIDMGAVTMIIASNPLSLRSHHPFLHGPLEIDHKEKLGFASFAVMNGQPWEQDEFTSRPASLWATSEVSEGKIGMNRVE